MAGKEIIPFINSDTTDHPMVAPTPANSPNSPIMIEPEVEEVHALSVVPLAVAPAVVRNGGPKENGRLGASAPLMTEPKSPRSEDQILVFTPSCAAKGQEPKQQVPQSESGGTGHSLQPREPDATLIVAMKKPLRSSR
ncbi:hypothetical protein C2845_PM15G02590 [Panicum miliaceum]|uniref:Uncharacterized protein n=1 Tax=Panicum miliaceum TaxID=4540 RepID=A0A3L6QBD0_PANMI|nr:hypothetical protein C2845_PM15G02590 [Panicum miliaceum]